MQMINKFVHKTKMFGELVMFSHTLFSLPFAIISMIWAAGGIPSWRVMLWSLVALVAARNGANAFNRIADLKFDAANPRTANRHMPRKLLLSREVHVFVIVNFAIFILAAGMLNLLCLVLSPVAVVLICSYSYTKRFTWLCHLYLGFTIASAPIGAWFAVTGQFAIIPFIIGTVVMLWIAGFDIIYATQDIEFDRNTGLFSIPGVFGLKGALLISRSLHGIMVMLLVSLYVIQGLGWLYLTGIIISMLLLATEHRIIKPSSRKVMNLASYNLNQVISMTILFFTLADQFLL
ncbi:4-hydroxybenzoate polyprenyltransferase [Paenibacillus vortex V453]|jgi:4-hydroxybenzoate polyprenyltransferase|uniref:4-hydroxybenzoate polyprenyltransferase n=2 Tax=Paenibacillus TaxID=44249 RepID=A0A163JQP0_9BACL|nr:MULTISPECIES: UbiA-like polyprenyltransferase [Paenibacillus]ANA80718.1 4-hydroxybenzoate octaprenyltransferase [Paenibacillus glucanolyticus]AVV55211.1 4-hydroxybenzoate octaprenyltransferase [Paenibacillus glucanolyticus]AWP29797.1 4-hydroxybenzoate octaprenyltransferase [Paenibacillus sp. Cedars]EFU42945.1 4-hydroxybenzoate polyprenyltransferase [Paenibacillus vortex V453]ETT30814.1 4-hydroxybenzoate polyprenyltransferase [Paenibacillus sp. FSL R5-808]